MIDNHLKTVTQSVFFRIYNELNIIDDIETNNEKKNTIHKAFMTNSPSSVLTPKKIILASLINKDPL